MHTILGAGGAVANALTRELTNNNETIRLTSRKEIKTGGKNTTWQKADLLSQQDVSAVVKGSDIVYLTAGLVYNKDIWRQQWPIIMQNVMNAVKDAGARLIFFDNVYMYGLVDGPITEDTPYKPVSVKGEVRAGIAERLMDEVKAGKINATIARGADFYGMGNMNAVLDMMVIDKIAKGERAQWVGDVKKLHNYSYIPDMGKAMYLLGQTPESANQIWHMPTAKPITGKQMLELIGKTYGVEPKYFAINKFMLQLFGLFDKMTKEVVEMYYQFDHDYNFNSDKFEKAFNFKPTTYEDGLKVLSQTLYKKQ